METVKYPRTLHLPSSQTVHSDDKVISNLEGLKGLEVVITEKMDGECTTLYSDYMHARSETYARDEARHWLKKKHAEVGYQIPNKWRVCGENVFAEHSIAYRNLLSYFYVFSVWSEHNRALSWDDTETWAALLGFPVVPVLYRGLYDEKVIAELPNKLDLERQEGFVVRPADSFAFEDFPRLVTKWVRKGHVQTDEHWMHQKLTVNGLKYDEPIFDF